MSRSIEDITSELIKLPKRDRLEIARFLLFLDNRSSGANDIEACWDKEITDRVRAVERGEVSGLDFDQVMRDIEERYKP